jgi:hypothetical protein
MDNVLKFFVFLFAVSLLSTVIYIWLRVIHTYNDKLQDHDPKEEIRKRRRQRRRQLRIVEEKEIE